VRIVYDSMYVILLAVHTANRIIAAPHSALSEAHMVYIADT
jgi:hypothetical protein